MTTAGPQEWTINAGLGHARVAANVKSTYSASTQIVDIFKLPTPICDAADVVSLFFFLLNVTKEIQL